MGSKRKRSAKEAPPAAPAAKKQQKLSAKPANKAAEPPLPLSNEPFVDNPRGDELKREVQLYDVLSSEENSQRLQAANIIVTALIGKDGVEESTLQRHMERRLFRGLASGRKGARLGFSIVLTEILSQLFGSEDLAGKKYNGLTFEKVFDFLVTKTKPEGDLSGQEQKDHALGLLFGLQCFVKANILFTVNGRWDVVLGKLFELSNKKSWTREECGWVIVEAVGQMEHKHAAFTLQKLCDAGFALSPEGVGIWLVARDRFPKLKCPSKPWGHSGNPLDHLKELAKALKESSSQDDNQQAKQTGTWNPKLHFVWNIVLRQYVKAANNNEKHFKSSFENFWKVAVDENLFSTSASNERKFWGFLVFQKMIQDHISSEKLIASIFSRNLMKCLINHLQEKDRFLYKAADKSLKVLSQAAQENSASLVVVLQGLIDHNGAYSFDRITKTKTMDKLLNAIDESNGESVIGVLAAPALAVTSIDSPDLILEAERRRQMFGDYVLTAIRHTVPAAEASWIKVALSQLASLAYSKNPKANPAVSEKTRTCIRDRLSSSFAHLLSREGGYTYPCDIVLSCEPNAVTMDVGITNAKDGAIATMQKLLKKMKKGSEADVATYQTLALLYGLIILQLYDGDSEAVTILDDLNLCYESLVKHKGNGETEVESIEVLVELLLSFSSRPSALLRKVTQRVFGAFADKMTAGALKLITDVLESSENLRGQQQMFDQEAEDEDGMDIDDVDEEMDSDVEIVDMDGDEGHLNGNLEEEENDEESDEETEGDESDDDEEAPADEEADKQLNDALAKILGTHPGEQDLEAEDDAGSDSDMTDSGMDALTPKLEEVLGRMQKKGPSKKKEQKDAKENMVNFKSRVLDLLDIYAKKQASSPIATEIVLPLLRLIRTTQTKHLSDHAFSVIQSFAKTRSKSVLPTGVAIKAERQLELIQEIHEEILKDQSKLLARAASTASLSLASGLYKADKEKFETIGKVYLGTMRRCEREGVKIQTSFVLDWVNWWQSHLA